MSVSPKKKKQTKKERLMKKSNYTRKISFERQIELFSMTRNERTVVTRVNLINELMTKISNEYPSISREDSCSMSMDFISEMDTDYH